MNSTFAVPGYIVVLGIAVTIGLFSALGHILAGRFVEPRHNLGFLFGAIFGLLVIVNITCFSVAFEDGMIALLITAIYTTFVVRLQRGY